VTWQVIQGDCLTVMAGMDAGSVDSIVSDPPYGINFMSKKWDHGVPGVPFWVEALRVLKPGGYLLAFGGSRTYHRLACAVEDAGFEIRDQIMWVYSSGFPKSLDIGKAIDKAAGAEREVVGTRKSEGGRTSQPNTEGIDPKASIDITAPATDAAKQWDGWGSNLKPAHEPIVMARKPLSEKTVAANVLKWGTGGINIDGCRVPFAGSGDESESKDKNRHGDFGSAPPVRVAFGEDNRAGENYDPPGRFPANLIHDGSPEVLAGFPETGQPCGSIKKTTHRGGMFHIGTPGHIFTEQDGDNRSASRFFYSAKSSKSERTHKGQVENKHPTVKPLALMRYLVRLITPPGGRVLDPFAGSGSTVVAAVQEGFSGIGIELNPEYCEIARRRIDDAINPKAGEGEK